MNMRREESSFVTIDAELTRLGANCFSAEIQGYFLGVADVANCVARMCHELGAVDLGAKLGAELWKLTNLIFFS
jgi:hypothetical protein